MRNATLRAQLEATLASRFHSPLAFRQKEIETVSAGIPEIDSLTGGLPRGALTEICGPVCSGRATVLLSILTSLTTRTEMCALVDARDALDPHSACTAGVELGRLLWVRCGNIEQALRATDLVLHGGGFGLVALDLSDIPPQTVRRVPLNSWFRFRRVVENTPTVLIVLEQEPYAKTCASLVLQLETQAAHWIPTAEQENPLSPGGQALHASMVKDGISGLRLVSSRRDWRDALQITKMNFQLDSRDGCEAGSPHSYLLQGAQMKVEVVRSRMQHQEAAALASCSHLAALAGNVGHANTLFETRAAWQGKELTGGK